MLCLSCMRHLCCAWRQPRYNMRRTLCLHASPAPLPAPQTRSFHEPLALAPLDALARASFAAEVLDAAKKKVQALRAESFAMLVCEEAALGLVGVVEVAVGEERDVAASLPGQPPKYAYVSSMAVAPELRRRGVASALLVAAEQQALRWGQSWLALHVYETNRTAVQLYQAYGMTVVAQDPAWRGWVGAKVRILMVKRLAA